MKKTARVLISLLLSLVCLVTIFSSSSYAMSEEEAVNRGYDIFTAWFKQTYSSYQYMLYDYISPYKPTVEKNEGSAVYQSLLFAWRAATFNISSEAGYAEKEVAYYESFIFDMFYDDDSGTFFQTLIKEANNYNKSAEKELKALGASVEKKVADSLLAISHEYADSIPAGGWDVDKLTEAYGIISRASEVKDACKIITKTTDFFGYAKTGWELLENICKVQAVLNSTGKIRGILDDLINRTSFSNPALKQALTELKTCMACPFTQYDFIPLLIGKTTVTEMTKEFGKKAWSGVLECLLGVYGKAVEAGQAAGTFLADSLLNTSDSVAAYYKLRALYRFEEELKSYIKSIEKNALNDVGTAKKFNTAVAMLYKTYINGTDIYKSYIDKTYREGLLNQFFPGIKDDVYKKLCSDLDDIKKTIQSSYMVQEELAEEMYSIYVKAYRYTPVPMAKEIENYDTDLARLVETDYSFRNTISKDWTLSDDVVIYGDLTITGGTLDLNGHTITIYGNLIQSGGTVNCNGGTLHITGDYRVQTPQINGDGEITGYGYSVGRLQMTKAADQIIVGGSFYTSSSDSSIYTIFSAG
ncbi:MAG: hypothetical protein IJK98_00890, partial [Clostridia bacterium]|nr:hypothetical protein [Clostridia bacterium]